MAFKVVLIYCATVITVLMNTNGARDCRYNFRQSTQCQGKTKLNCTRLVFHEDINGISKIPNPDKTKCCLPKGVYQPQEICDQCIDISNSCLQDISLIALKNWTKVTYIDMSYNFLKVLNINTLKNTILLSHLNLSHNNLEHIKEGALSKVTELTTLDLSYNSLNNLNNTFSKNVELSYLNLSNNQLENLYNGTFFATNKLSHLDLSNNNLSHLDPATFLKTTELSFLDLRNNSLAEVSKQLFHTTVQLSHLDISYNNLQHVDDHLFITLSKLNYLNLKNNSLVSLGGENIFTSQVNLKTLILGNNRLENIDAKVLMRLWPIDYLDLSQNRLNCSPELRNLIVNHSLDINATCVNLMPNSSVSQTALNNFPGSETKINTSNLYSKLGKTNGRRHNWAVMTAIIAGAVLVSLITGCVITLVSIYFWKRFKKTSTGEREVIIDAACNNACENYYYSSVTVPWENATSFATPPDLPDRPTPTEMQTFEHKYDYIEASGGLQQTTGPSTEGSNTSNNVRVNFSPRTENGFPKEMTVVNDLYK